MQAGHIKRGAWWHEDHTRCASVGREHEVTIRLVRAHARVVEHTVTHDKAGVGHVKGVAIVLRYHRERTVCICLVCRRGDFVHVTQVANADLLELQQAPPPPELLTQPLHLHCRVGGTGDVIQERVECILNHPPTAYRLTGGFIHTVRHRKQHVCEVLGQVLAEILSLAAVASRLPDRMSELRVPYRMVFVSLDAQKHLCVKVTGGSL